MGDRICLWTCDLRVGNHPFNKVRAWAKTNPQDGEHGVWSSSRVTRRVPVTGDATLQVSAVAFPSAVQLRFDVLASLLQPYFEAAGLELNMLNIRRVLRRAESGAVEAADPRSKAAWRHLSETVQQYRATLWQSSCLAAFQRYDITGPVHERAM